METKLIASLVGVIMTILAVTAGVGHFLPDALDSPFGFVLVVLALVGVNLLFLVAGCALNWAIKQSRPEHIRSKSMGFFQDWFAVYPVALLTTSVINIKVFASIVPDVYTRLGLFAILFIIVVILLPMFIIDRVDNYIEKQRKR